MVAVTRQFTRFPALNRGFLGENNREGLTDEVFQAGALYRCRNYHLIGRGRLRKRQGSTKLVAAQVNGSNAVQQLAMYEWGTTRHLLALCNGGLYRLNGTTWTAIAGSLSFTAGADNRITTTHFRDGSGNLIVGIAPGTDRLWKWNGTGNATTLTDTGIGPQYAVDLVEYQGRLWALGTQNGATILEYSDDQNSVGWANGNYIQASRESPGVGLSRHGAQGLIVFHQRSTHAVYFDASAATPWVVRPIDNRIGCISRDSIVYDRGITYWAGPDGFYRLRGARGPVEFIGYGVGDAWAGLTSTRRSTLTGFARGGTYPEIVWLASDASSQTHNVGFVWNTAQEAWTLFDSAAGYFNFNTGCDWTDANGRHLSVLGDYSGYVWAAWGDDEYSTGYTDEGDTGAPVRSQLQTGFLDFGYPGQKRLKEGWMDAVVTSNRSFDLEVTGLGETEGVAGVATAGVTGAKLSVDFVLGQSRLAAAETPTPGQFKVSLRSRAFQFNLTEQSTDAPHTLNHLGFWWLPRSRRFNA